MPALRDIGFPALSLLHTNNCLAELYEVRQSNVQLIIGERVYQEKTNWFIFLLSLHKLPPPPLQKDEKKFKKRPPKRPCTWECKFPGLC